MPRLSIGFEREAPTVFYEIKDVPTNSVILLSSAEAARNYPRGDIRLGVCQESGVVLNTHFEPDLTEYSANYDGTQAHSPSFNAFHKDLADRLISQYGLRGKTIVEIGCGQGEFLTLLCQGGGNRGTGFDPCFIENGESGSTNGEIRFVKDFYSSKYPAPDPDFVCCKMTLEHIADPEGFVRQVRTSIGDVRRALVFFMVPNAAAIFEQGAFWDVYYEHCCYFTEVSLRALFQQAGFEVLAHGTEYGGQYISLCARPAASSTQTISADELQTLETLVSDFAGVAERQIHEWKTRIRQSAESGKRTVLWGGGSKAVAFLTTLGIKDEVDFVIDINPRKQGTYLPGTGHPVLGPDSLRDRPPDVVIVMNPLYEEEIRASLSARSLTPRVLSI